MGLKTEAKTIGAYTYKVTALNALDGRKVFVRLVKMVGPGLSAYKASPDMASALTQGMGALISALSEEDVEHLCNKLSASTEVSGGDYGEKRRPQLDGVFLTHFAANYFEMIEWLIFALEVNFGSFFEKAGGLMTSKSTSPAASATS